MTRPVEDEIHDIILRNLDTAVAATFGSVQQPKTLTIKDIELTKQKPMLNLPKHVSLTLEHNGHKAVYETVQQYNDSISNIHWVPGDSRQRAYDANDMWCVQWYPDTPVAYCSVYGHTIEEILEYINS